MICRAMVDIGGMRMRDHDKGDLGLAALTLTAAAAAAGIEVVGRVRSRLQHRRSGDPTSAPAKQLRHSQRRPRRP
jgi:hypothetical protein